MANQNFYSTADQIKLLSSETLCQRDCEVHHQLKYQMGKYFGANGSGEEWMYSLPMIRLLLVILLPVLPMLRIIRKSLVFSCLLLFLLYWNNPVTYWNGYDPFFKIAGYGCAICAAYALLWLLKELPHQQV